MANISADPFTTEGTSKLNNAFNYSAGIDGYDNVMSGSITGHKKKMKKDEVVTSRTVEHINAAGATTTMWDKDQIVAAYKSLLLSVESLKAAVNGRNPAASRAAANKIKRDADAIEKLVK